MTVVFRKASALAQTTMLDQLVMTDAPIVPAGMTPDEIQIVEALYRCRFLPGSTQKRFVRFMADRDRNKVLTPNQRAYLWAIAWSWRRQLSPSMVTMARAYSGGAGIRGRKT